MYWFSFKSVELFYFVIDLYHYQYKHEHEDYMSDKTNCEYKA